MTRTSMFCSSRWVAKLCRKVCSETRFLISAIWAAAWQARLSWRVVIGCAGSRPGNNQPQARAVGHAQRRLVLEPGCGIEQPRYLLGAEHHRQLARLVNEMGVLDNIVTLERDPEKEPQGRYGLIEGGRANTARR